MPYNNDNGEYAGKVQVFSFKMEELTKVGNKDVMTGSNSGDYFGYCGLAISTDGMNVVAGSHMRNYVKVFKLVGDGWSLVGNVINGEMQEWFGWSVSLSDDRRHLVIGAIYNSYEGLTLRGRVVVYDFIKDDENWVIVGQSFYGENSYDYFGASVSISGSGSRLAVGGELNDNANGLNAGHMRVFVFDEDSSQWIQIDKDIDGESGGDTSGSSVALSNDAKFVAVGAPAGWYGDRIGSARVYQMKCQSDD